MTIRKAQLAALVAAGITAESPDQDIKKAYYKVAATPLSKDNLPVVKAALGGDLSGVVDDIAAPATKPKAEKAAKAPSAPKPVMEAEAPHVALKRLKSVPKTAERWARVTEVLEMGKKGPTRVRIKCDDKGEGGKNLFRDIKVQDLFQVKYSAEYAKKNARKGRKAKPKAEAKTAAATE